MRKKGHLINPDLKSVKISDLKNYGFIRYPDHIFILSYYSAFFFPTRVPKLSTTSTSERIIRRIAIPAWA